MKKIISILIILIIIVAVGFGIYWFFDRQEGGSRSGQGFSIGDLFPFGKSDQNVKPNNGTSTGEPNPTPNPTLGSATPRLWKISEKPQSGAIAINSSSSPVVRFIDKATGNVFESSLASVGVKRISNTTIPKVNEAVWFPKGDAVVLRYLNDNNTLIQSYLAKLSGIMATTTEGELLQELQGSFLPSQIFSLAIESASGKLVYTSAKTSGGISLIIANPDGSKPKQIFDSGVRDWRVGYPKSDLIALVTKASNNAQGFLYFIKSDGSSLQKILGPKNGLSTSVNSDASEVVYSEIKDGALAFGVLNIKTGESSDIPKITLAEKCVWSKNDVAVIYCAVPKSLSDGVLPDDWYQGKVSFNDVIWKIDTKTLSTEIVIDPESVARTSIDAVDLKLDPDEKYLIFTNKIDSALWGLKILAES